MDLTTVPDVVGLSSVEAAEVMRDLGFDVFRCDTGYCVPVTVTGQTPTAGARVPAGLNVQLFGGTAAATARCPKNPLEPTVAGVEAGLSGGGGLLCRYARQGDGHVMAQGSVSLTQAQSSALQAAYEDRDLAMVDCSTSSRPIYSVVSFDPEHSSFSTVTVDLSMCGTIYAADPGATDDDWLGGLATQRHVRLLDQIWTGN